MGLNEDDWNAAYEEELEKQTQDKRDEYWARKFDEQHEGDQCERVSRMHAKSPSRTTENS